MPQSKLYQYQEILAKSRSGHNTGNLDNLNTHYRALSNSHCEWPREMPVQAVLCIPTRDPENPALPVSMHLIGSSLNQD